MKSTPELHVIRCILFPNENRKSALQSVNNANGITTLTVTLYFFEFIQNEIANIFDRMFYLSVPTGISNRNWSAWTLCSPSNALRFRYRNTTGNVVQTAPCSKTASGTTTTVSGTTTQRNADINGTQYITLLDLRINSESNRKNCLSFAYTSYRYGKREP